MKPWEIEKMTPGETYEMIDGYAWQQDREMEKLAWMTAHLMNSTGNYKRRIDPERLLGRKIGSRVKKVFRERVD